MDVMRTPPHSTCFVSHTGERSCPWAPKKLREYRKPPLSSGRKSSSRSLASSSILVQDDDGENSRLLEISERGQSRGCKSTRRESSSSSTVFSQDNDIEIVSVVEDAVPALVIDRASCSCPSVTGILTELENMKLNMEILESRTDALQSLANVQKVCFTPNEYFR